MTLCLDGDQSTKVISGSFNYIPPLSIAMPPISSDMLFCDMLWMGKTKTTFYFALLSPFIIFNIQMS